MKLTAEENGGRLTVWLAGEVDHHAARELAREMEKRLAAALPRECVLDLREVRFMDSSGIALILRIHKRMAAIGGRLRVENVQSQPMRVLEAAGITRLVGVSANL